MRLVVAATLRPDSNCVDVGANVGKLLAIFTELAPAGDHIAFEPVPHLADALAARFPNVEIRRSATSNEAGRTTFVVHTGLESRSSLRSVGYSSSETETIEVAVERLDDVLGGREVDLLKIDVEGAEGLVLEGALDTLRKQRPVLLFEHQKTTAGFYGLGPERIHALLTEEASMRVFDMEGAGPYSAAEMRAAYDTGSRFNFLAVPAS